MPQITKGGHAVNFTPSFLDQILSSVASKSFYPLQSFQEKEYSYKGVIFSLCPGQIDQLGDNQNLNARSVVSRKLKGRALKKRIETLMQSGDSSAVKAEILLYPPRAVINPLFGLLLSTNPRVRWNAVVAMGDTVNRLAQEDMESARIIIRRLMWQLNDESGGIGWGCPEAMAEILARNRKLAEEFAPIVISYVRQDGNFLEHEPLQPGAIWAVGRLAHAWPDLAAGASFYIVPFLSSTIPHIRGNAVWALGKIGDHTVKELLVPLLEDYSEIEMYRDGQLVRTTISELTAEALSLLKGEKGLKESA